MVKVDLGLLRIERIVFHYVPKRFAAEQAEIRLSQRESELDDRLSAFFEERIKLSLLSSAIGVYLNPELPSPIPPLILEQLSGAEADFVAASQEFARHLHRSQDGNNPAGILAVILGHNQQTPGLMVLKMEPQHGLTLEETDTDGIPSFDIHEVENLMLTNRTKVYKAGAFFQGGTELATIDGLVVDLQHGRNTRDVAGFFLSKFLGCSYSSAPDIGTRNIFEASQKFFNDSVEDKERGSRYLFALLAEMNSNATEIDPHAFAEEHLEGTERRDFMTFLAQEGIPDVRIAKDTSLIRTQLKRVIWGFEHGMSLIGTPEEYEQYVSRRNDNGQEVTEIRDELVRVNAK